MVKIITIAMMAIMLSGCFGTQVRVRTEVQESFVPILYCPAPPVTTRPELPIHQMTPAQTKSDGEVAKHYKATVKVLQGYIEELEKALNQYDTTNEAYEVLKKELFEKIKKDGLDTNTTLGVK